MGFVVIAAEDVPDVADAPDGLAASGDLPGSGGLRTSTGAGRAEQQLAVLAVRLEMAAVYLRLVRG